MAFHRAIVGAFPAPFTLRPVCVAESLGVWGNFPVVAKSSALQSLAQSSGRGLSSRSSGIEVALLVDRRQPWATAWRRTKMSLLEKILVPTDFSDASEAALKYACGLADQMNAGLCILHTVEDPYQLGTYSDYYTPPPEFAERIERQASANLQGVLTPEQRERYRATLVLSHGAPAHEILKYLHEHKDVGLVVMATHGRGGVARLMMGSVADKVLRAAPCPVLVIRASHPKESASQAEERNASCAA
jgi:universal stress protein A